MVGTYRLTTRRFVLAIATAASVLITSGSSALGAFEASDPNPLRTNTVIRVHDAAADGQIVAFGWREGAAPGRLRVAFSTDGGATFRKANDKLRFYSVAGRGGPGLSLDICRNAIWSGSIANFPGDASGDSDVLISRRLVGGSAGQAFVTSPAASRSVRSLDIACVGRQLLAIAWIERVPAGDRARLMLRDLASLSPAATNRIFNLGPANARDGISVAASGKSIYAAWSKGNRRDLQLARFLVGSGSDPTITRRADQRLSTRDASRPELAARGRKLVVAYSDDGKLKAKLSANRGQTFGSAIVLLGAGSVGTPSYATSADLSGPRIVIEAFKKLPNDAPRKRAPVRLESTDSGATWSDSGELGNRGPRVTALQKLTASTSRMKEAWHDDGPILDTLRAQREAS